MALATPVYLRVSAYFRIAASFEAICNKVTCELPSSCTLVHNVVTNDINDRLVIYKAHNCYDDDEKHYHYITL